MILESKGVMDKEDICINLDGNTHLISLGYPMCTQLYFVTVLRSRLPNFLHTLIYTLCTQYYKKLFRCLQLTQYCILPAIFRTTKLCFETKSTKLFSKMLLVKSSDDNFIFLPVLYLIMWLMKASKNFGKIAILKIWS